MELYINYLNRPAECKMREIIAEICFEAANKFFNFEKLPLQVYESNLKSKKCSLFLSENVNNTNDEFYDKLVKVFTIRLVILTGEKKLEYGNRGLDFFILAKNEKFYFHSNAARVTKLPAGVGKLDNPIHRIDKIIFALNGRKFKCETCPLISKCNFDNLEKRYEIRLEIWSKSKIKDKFSFVKLRNSKKSTWPLARLHFDGTTGRYFLILDTSLYFRGSLKLLRKNLLI